MTPDQLHTFAVVALHKNISTAATVLHLSQPAVSGQLRLLRESFGEALYHRDGRGIRLTAVGLELAACAAQVKSALEKATALRAAMRGGGILRIGASTTPASFLLPHLVAQMRAQHPQAVLELRHGNSAEIVAGLPDLDVALIEGPVNENLPAGIGIHPWHDDRIVAIVPEGHPLLKRRSRPGLEVLAKYPLVWREPGSGVRQVVERAFSERKLTVQIAIELAGVEGVKEAVRAGMGIGFVSAMAMRHGDSVLSILPTSAESVLRRRFSILVPHAVSTSLVCQAFLAICLARRKKK